MDAKQVVEESKVVCFVLAISSREAFALLSLKLSDDDEQLFLHLLPSPFGSFARRRRDLRLPTAVFLHQEYGDGLV